MKKDLFVIATRSSGKIRDFAHILGSENREFLTLNDIEFFDEIEENGNSFAENAMIKSQATAEFLKQKNRDAIVLADDSGLEVFSLNGAPGILSARFSGVHGDDNANNEKLIEMLRDKDDKKARYFCALSYQKIENGIISAPQIFEGECRGSIILEPRGNMGFGYDPLFVPEGETRTFAEMELEEKKKISHRGNAIRALKKNIL